MLMLELSQQGRFTGEEITFIYPDLLTGLHGRFRDGEVVEARAVDIVAERCREGVKEVRLRLRTEDGTVWRREEATDNRIISYTKTVGWLRMRMHDES